MYTFHSGPDMKKSTCRLRGATQRTPYENEIKPEVGTATKTTENP
jgi:hypothetical protein